MTIQMWLTIAIQKLEDSSVDSARLDAEILLSDILDKDRSWILAHPEFTVQGDSLYMLDAQIKRRQNHEPIAYIRAKQEFYGREFIVSPDTLTPRPETETMVELVLDQIGDWGLGIGEKLQFIDVGTGSGCIIVSTALELTPIFNLQSPISFLGLDISEPALKIAKQNAKNLGADVEFKHFDLLNDELSSILNPLSSILIMANLPYVPTDFHINLAASHEPEFAIFGGEDGLDYYRKLFEQFQIGESGLKIGENCTILTEALPPQHEKLTQIALKNGFELLKTQDLIQVFIKKSRE